MYALHVQSRLPYRVDEDVIVVFDQIRIAYPYTYHDCDSDNEIILQRVRSVLFK